MKNPLVLTCAGCVMEKERERGMAEHRQIGSPWESSKEDTACVDEASAGIHHLMVYNDEKNTFEHVTETLVRVCKHNRIQAEQCTYIIHFTGRCSVKQGEYPHLKPMRDRLCDEGIRAEIK